MLYIATTATTDDSDLDLAPIVVLESGTSEACIKAIVDNLMDDCADGFPYNVTLIGDGYREMTAELATHEASDNFCKKISPLIGVDVTMYHTVVLDKGPYKNIYTLIRLLSA